MKTEPNTPSLAIECCSICKKELVGNNAAFKRCKECRAYRRSVKKKNPRYKRLKADQKARARERLYGDKDKYVGHLISSARYRARRIGREFTITAEDIVVPEYCPLLGFKFDMGHTHMRNRDTGPSLDRIDPCNGYVPGNVWVISFRANTLKNNATLPELELLVKNLREKMDEMKKDGD